MNPNESEKTIENEIFWKNHYDLLNSSGMSRVEYCRKNNLNYDRFGYWVSKWNRNKPEVANNLVSIKLKSADVPVAQSVLCTLKSKNGCLIQIHDESVFAMILEKLI